MGTQQLMLVILGLIIIGAAVTIGVGIFQDNAVSSARDALITDLNALAGRAQAYFRRPRMMGGGGRSFAGLTADVAGFAKLSSKSTNENGSYRIKTAGTAKQVVLEGEGFETGEDGTNKVKVEAVVTTTDSVAIMIIN